MEKFLLKIDSWCKWDRLRATGNSRLVRLTILVPVFGYLILFNDTIIRYLELSNIYFKDAFIEQSFSIFYRLYFFYFGFTFLAIAALIYWFWCPPLIQSYGSAAEFYRVEGPTTDERRLRLMALTILRPQFSETCTKRGLELEPFWISLGRTRPEGMTDAQARVFWEEMDRFIAQRAKGAESEKAHIMTQFFVPQKSARPILRRVVFSLYAAGFIILAVPTIHAFISVTTTVLERLSHAS